MDSSPPIPGTYAARAAYFADRVCSFCEHHNPTDASFCNECGSPLHLKPCRSCDAVDHQAATHCYHCGGAFPITTSTTRLPAVEPVASSTPGDAGLAEVPSESSGATTVVHDGWRSFRRPRFFLVGIAAILLAATYAAYRVDSARSDAFAIASQPIEPAEARVPPAAPPVPLATPVPLAPQPRDLEAKTTRALDAPMPTNLETTRHASARPRPVQSTARAAPPVVQRRTVAHVGAPAAKANVRQPDPRQTMQVALASCGGDLIDRIVCDQRVRRHYCEGQWGRAPECTSGVAKDHGQ